VRRHWRERDEGLWEPRSGRAHHTHSRVLCWTALDRLLELHERGLLHAGQTDRLRSTRDLIRDEVRARAWNAELSSYVSELGGNELDASLLLLPWYGFEPASSERMQHTYRRIRERLGAGGPLLYRYLPDGETVEGAFGVCSFWGAEFLARGGGSLDQAAEAFDGLCGYANDLGLYGEEIDPGSGAALGNFPQAFTHVGLINAALSLRDRLAHAPEVRS
jgi:GH15 family glucan-1,4-alpha-glucosidase